MRVALIYGGKSTEHDVSVASAQNIYRLLIEAGHHVIPIAITMAGHWYLQQGEPAIGHDSSVEVSLIPGRGAWVGSASLDIDVAFAPTHGWGGEDGNLQGLCTLCSIPLVGCDTLSSAVGMYKMVTQQLCAAHAIATVPTILVSEQDALTEALYHTALTTLGPRLFIKAESSGSSVGVVPLKSPTFPSFVQAVEHGRLYSERVLIQPLIEPLVEVECAILERLDGTLVAAGPGRVVDPGASTVGFLDYHHKYTPTGGAYIQVPSGLGEAIDSKIRDLARQAFRAIKGSGYARIDFFVSDGVIMLNEINTAPGMTSQSHWPRLIEAHGIALPVALTELLEGARATWTRLERRSFAPPEKL